MSTSARARRASSQIWPHLVKQEGRMSAEEALSGRGLENLHNAICAADGIANDRPGAAAISAMALGRHAIRKRAGGCCAVRDAAGPACRRHGAADAGARRRLSGRRHRAKADAGPRCGAFRAAFEDKAPHQAIMRGIAVMVMTHPTAALEGLAAWVRQPGSVQPGRRGLALCLTILLHWLRCTLCKAASALY